MALGSSLVVDLSDLHHSEIRHLALSDDTATPAGTALLRIDRFGFTANNVTYATYGGVGYWSFFPAPDGRGQIPVWGHATVLRSSRPEVREGARYYGFLPMATHLLVTPTDVGPRGFTEASPHRAQRAAVYNRYLDRSTDPLAAGCPDPALEVVLRPLFSTAFLLHADLAEQGWFGADALVLTSASSRTALATAHLVQQLRSRPALVGLTRADHVADARALGCYDRVLSDDDVDSLPVGRTALVDLTGDGRLVAALHRHLGESLLHSAIVGATHWQADPVVTAALPGPKRALFLAPEVADRLRSTHGDRAVEAAVADAWAGFARRMGDWLRIRTAIGAEAVQAAYAATLAGATSPRDGWVLSLRPGADG